MIRTSALRRETRISVICDLSISVNINDAFNQQTIEWLSFWNFQRFSLGVIVLSVYLKLALLNMDAKIWYKKAALQSHNSLSAYERKTANSRTSSVNWLPNQEVFHWNEELLGFDPFSWTDHSFISFKGQTVWRRTDSSWYRRYNRIWRWLVDEKERWIFLSEITNSNTKCTPFCHISAVIDLSTHSMLDNF